MNPPKTAPPQNLSQMDKFAESLAGAMARRTPDVEFYGRITDDLLRLIPSQNACHPGSRPVEYNVIVAMPDIPEKKGNIFLTAETRDMMEMASQCGRIIGASPVAFNYDHFYEKHPELAPKVGDLVWIARYAGGEMVGKDGRRYRVVKDKDVGQVIEPPAAE